MSTTDLYALLNRYNGIAHYTGRDYVRRWSTICSLSGKTDIEWARINPDRPLKNE